MKTPGQNGSPERRSGTLKYERLFIDDIDDAVMPAKDYRIEYNQTRPHEANRLEPAEGGAPRPRRPDHPDISNHRNPAKSLTRDKGTEAMPRKKMLATATDSLLTIGDVLDELQVARSTFDTWRTLGTAPACIKLPNGQLRIRRSDLDGWLAARVEMAEAS